jgi:hypothetical protein
MDREAREAPRRTRIDKSAPAVRGALNKLADANYPAVAGEIQRVALEAAAAACDGLELCISEILGKAYRDADCSRLCVAVVLDIFGGMQAEGRARMAQAVDGEVRDTMGTLRERVTLRAANPALDYGAFCDSGMRKRDVVGRARTLFLLMGEGGEGAMQDRGTLQGMLQGSNRTDFAQAHVDVLGVVLREGGGPKAGGAVESLLECFGEMLGPRAAAKAATAPRAAHWQPQQQTQKKQAPEWKGRGARETAADARETRAPQQDHIRRALDAAVRTVGGAQALPSLRSRFQFADLVRPIAASC